VTRRRFFSSAHARRFTLTDRLYTPRATPPAGLAALSRAWVMASRLKQAVRRAASVRLDRPVLSVGSLGVGGSGKTPFTRWIARAIARRGCSAAVLTRGYRWMDGGASPHAFLPGVGSATPVPDEARLFLNDGLAVGAHPRRAAAAAALVRAGTRPDVYLLDDGFQHRQVHRDWDLVVLSARELAAPHRPLPAGPFRESWSALERADRVAITGLDAELARGIAARSPADLGLPSGAPPALAGLVWGGLVELEEWLAGRHAARAESASGPHLAFSGIADPLSFERLLASRGLEVETHVVFPDHHRYSSVDLARLLALRPARGALVTTEKDAARLPEEWAPPGACRVARAELCLWRGEEDLLDDLARLVPGEL
jgi:tetraacyldisaccharide 4'-kinase